MQIARTISSPAKNDGGVRTTEAVRPFVHVLADSSDKLAGVCSALERQFTVAGERLDAEARLSQVPFAVVVRAELRDVGTIAAIKKRAGKLAKATKRIFLVEHSSHVGISQAYICSRIFSSPYRIIAIHPSELAIFTTQLRLINTIKSSLR